MTGTIINFFRRKFGLEEVHTEDSQWLEDREIALSLDQRQVEAMVSIWRGEVGRLKRALDCSMALDLLELGFVEMDAHDHGYLWDLRLTEEGVRVLAHARTLYLTRDELQRRRERVQQQGLRAARM